MNKKFQVLSAFFLTMVMCLSLTTITYADEPNTASLVKGVNVISESANGITYNIDEDKVVAIKGTDPLLFENCTFHLSGNVFQLKNINSEYSSKLAFFNNVTLKNCKISAIGASAKGAGTTALISMFNGANVTLEDCTIIGTDCNYQFMAAYGTVTSNFNKSLLTVTGNKNGWVFVSYPNKNDTVTMNFNKTDFTANNGNIRVYAQNQNDVGTTITNITNDSHIIFDDNIGGGFVFGGGTNHVNIDKSNVDVSNNGGNASNGGVWTVTDSTLIMNGNKSGHGLSCQYFQMTKSKFESMHNGYAGVFTGTGDSSFTNCDVTIQCNGENLMSYSGLDITLKGHTLNVDNCRVAYLGTVGRSGSVITMNGSSVVMADAVQFGVDSHSQEIKSNCTPVITEKTKLATATSHYLFTNPNVDKKYARGNTEKDSVNYVSNDADLWLDVLYDKAGNVLEKTVKDVVTAADSQYIDTFDDNELAHHTYNWSKGVITDEATQTKYGVMAYECATCHRYMTNKDNHVNSYNCLGTYVYAPLVGLAFDANTDDEVKNMPKDQTSIAYEGQAIQPTNEPQREGYTFLGWYTDEQCTEKYDFETQLTDHWTVVYAKWVKNTTWTVEHHYYTSVDGEEYKLDGIVSEEEKTGTIGEVVKVEDIEHKLEYNENSYRYDHDSGDMTLSDDKDNKLVIEYRRDYSTPTTYTVEHHYFTSTDGKEYVLDGIVISEEYKGHVHDIIKAEDFEKVLEYNGQTYQYAKDNGEIKLTADKENNKLIIEYRREYTTPTIDINPTPESPDNTTKPNTGDNYDLFGPMLTLLAGGAGIIILGLNKYKKHQ